MNGCNISQFDLCQHSVTLSDSDKALANHQYRSYLLALQQAAGEFEAPKNIYLGGSLALQEPALHFSDGQCQGVYSDLDLFVTAQSLADIPALLPLPQQVEGVMPELERSFHYAPLIKPQTGMHIVTLEDLSLGMANPIVEDIRVNYADYMISGKSKSMARMLVARLCAYCLPYRNTSHAYTNQKENKAERTSMDTIKLVLNGLRLQCYGKMEQAHRISALMPLAEQGIFAGLMDKAAIFEWIRCREQYDSEQALPPLDIAHFIHRAWCAGVNVPLNSPVNKLLEAVATVYFNEVNVLDELALLLLSSCLYKLAPDWEHLHFLEDQLLLFIKNKQHAEIDIELVEQLQQALASHGPAESLLIQLFNRYMQLTTESVVSI